MRNRTRRVSVGLGMSIAATARQAPGAALPATEWIQDAEGGYTRKRQTLTLIEKLLIRGGAMPSPAPLPAPKKRGRPRKEAE